VWQPASDRSPPCSQDFDVSLLLESSSPTAVSWAFVTDRDIVVRGVAEGRVQARLGDISSGEVVALSPEDTVEGTIPLIRERAIRRIPVVEGGNAVGIVSIGDLAIERDEQSALGAQDRSVHVDGRLPVDLSCRIAKGADLG